VRAEQLLEEIEPDKQYPYDYLWFRITGYRPDHDSRLLLPGEQVRHDLRLYVEDLSDSADVAADSVGEPVLTVDDITRAFHVSSKTVSRWRRQGLVSRRFVFGRRKRIGFLKSSVDRFVDRNELQIRRGGKFCQLSEQEKETIVGRARRLARAGGSLAEVSRRIARRLDRAPETVRYTIRKFDEANPEIAVFPDGDRPLTHEARETVFRLFQRGIPVAELARRFARTRTTIYRVVNEVRAGRLLQRPIEYIDHESFDDPGSAAEIMAPMPSSEDAQYTRSRVPKGLPAYLESLYEVPLLSREQEQHLFRKMNYLKYRAAKLREQLDVVHVSAGLTAEIENFLEQASEIKNQLVRANLRLVVSIAKRHVRPNRGFFELVSDGNMSLIRAAEKFDFSRGNKFSTYASWAIMKNFARSIPGESHRTDRFRTGQEAVFDGVADERRNEFEQESHLRRMRETIGKSLDELDDRERQIIIARFGLDETNDPQTLEQLGVAFGVTKERVRQLEARALEKLRKVVCEEQIEAEV